jgi:hypothetical protein
MLSGCPQTSYPDFETADVEYQFLTLQTEHGEITAIPGRGIPGTQINITINPDPGYVVKNGSITIGDQRTGGLNYIMADRPPYSYLMPARNVSIKAEFVTAPPGNYTVTIVSPDHGSITPIPQHGPPGTIVTLLITPDLGYALKDGSLKNNGVVIPEDQYRIGLQAKNAVITAEFEKKTGAGEYIASGKKSLNSSNYDAAVSLFESAYQADPHNAEAILYSSFGKLASLFVSPRTRAVLSKVGLRSLPGSINQMFITGTDIDLSGVWLNIFDGKKLPKIDAPSGYPSGFRNHVVQNGSYYSNEDQTDKISVFYLYFIYNIITLNANTDETGMNKQGNPNGINIFLDDLLNYVFGEAFEDICRRVETLDYNNRILMDSAVMEKIRPLLEIFSLETAYTGEGVYLGRRELDAVLSCIRLLKASAEYFASYNWEIDTSFVKVRYLEDVDPEDFSSVNAMISQFLFQTNFGLEDKFKTKGAIDAVLLTRMLPFRNRFLTNRNSSMVDRARVDYLRALSALNDAIAYYNSPGSLVAPKAKEMLNDRYTWLGDGSAQLYKAISDRSNFPIPQNLPDGISWAEAATGARYIVSMDKLFTPGQFILPNLFTTEPGGNAPKFFGFHETESGGVLIETQSQFEQFEFAGFQINTSPIKEVFVSGLNLTNDKDWFHSLFPDALLTRRNAERIYEYYLSY